MSIILLTIWIVSVFSLWNSCIDSVWGWNQHLKLWTSHLRSIPSICWFCSAPALPSLNLNASSSSWFFLIWKKVLDEEPEKCVLPLGFLLTELLISENFNYLYCLGSTFRKQDWGMICLCFTFEMIFGCLKSMYTDGLCRN